MPEVASVWRDRTKRPRLHGDIITVLIGSGASTAKFYVHAALATQHSEFFRMALRDGEGEAETRIIRLPELPEGSAQVFEDSHSFLYTGKVFSSHKGEDNSPGYDEEWARLEFSWILGEVLASVTFKDALTDAIIHKLAATGYHPEDMYIGLAKIDADVGQAVNATFLQDVAIAFSKLENLPSAVMKVASSFNRRATALTMNMAPRHPVTRHCSSSRVVGSGNPASG